MRALLDVSILLALLDTAHVHHRKARAWLEANIPQGWASCPITENGCVRILSQPRYSNPLSLTEAAARLRNAQNTQWHQFWDDDISMLDRQRFDFRYLHGSSQLTDGYLLGLAVSHGGRFITLDQRLSPHTVRGFAPAHLVTL